MLYGIQCKTKPGQIAPVPEIPWMRNNYGFTALSEPDEAVAVEALVSVF